MAILDPNQIFYTSFEPKVKRSFIMYIDGFPSYIIKSVSGIGATMDEIVLNHINVYRKIKGKAKWNDIELKLFDPITPSGAQSVMEWVRLHHESVTGRDGYSDFYKKDITLNVLGPVGDIVGEFVVKGAFIKSFNLGDWSWDEENAAQELTLSLGMDYIIVNY